MAAFETKQYRNLFSLIGKEDQEINNRLNEILKRSFTEVRKNGFTIGGGRYGISGGYRKS